MSWGSSTHVSFIPDGAWWHEFRVSSKFFSVHRDRAKRKRDCHWRKLAFLSAHPGNWWTAKFRQGHLALKWSKWGKSLSPTAPLGSG